MIAVTELLYNSLPKFEWHEEPVLINPRHILTARPARCKPYAEHEDRVYRIKLVSGEVLFVISRTIGNASLDWALALSEGS